MSNSSSLPQKKVLFAHDHPFIRIDKVVYSESQFASSLWDRYLKEFHELKVLCRQRSLPYNLNINNLEVSSRPKVSFVFAPNLSSLKSQLFNQKQARDIVKENLKDIDAVIARLPSEFGLLAIKEAKRIGIPYAIEVAGCPWDGLWNYGNLKGKLYAPIMYARTRAAIKDSPFVFYVTKYFLQKRYPNKIGVSVGCSDVEISHPLPDVLTHRLDKDNKDSGPIILGLIGTLKTRFKGIQTVFEALSLIKSELPPLQFRILASGDKEPWIEEAKRYGIQDLVFFDGTLPAGEAVMNWLDNIDIYLQPSFKEGLPRALVEAMSRGCPAIGSTCAGIPELLSSDCLIKPGDSKHLSKLISNAVKNNEWRQSNAKLNWSTAAAYSIEKLSITRESFWSDFSTHVNIISEKGYNDV